MIEALKYFGMRIYSMPAVLINYAIVGWCIGMHRPKGPLLMLVVANILNAILDVFFILVLDMEVKGAALATVIADYISKPICRKYDKSSCIYTEKPSNNELTNRREKDKIFVLKSESRSGFQSVIKSLIIVIIDLIIFISHWLIARRAREMN